MVAVRAMLCPHSHPVWGFRVCFRDEMDAVESPRFRAIFNWEEFVEIVIVAHPFPSRKVVKLDVDKV